MECIKTDFTAPWVSIDLADEITIPYENKWELKSLNFKNKELRSIIIETIKALFDLTEYLSIEYMRAVETPSGFKLIAKNESWEEGCRLRDILRPQTMKLRFRLRDLYRKLHPENYADMPEFEDNFEKYCKENYYDYSKYADT